MIHTAPRRLGPSTARVSRDVGVHPARVVRAPNVSTRRADDLTTRTENLFRSPPRTRAHATSENPRPSFSREFRGPTSDKCHDGAAVIDYRGRVIDNKGCVIDNNRAVIDDKRGVIDETRGVVDETRAVVDENTAVIGANSAVVETNLGGVAAEEKCQDAEYRDDVLLPSGRPRSIS